VAGEKPFLDVALPISKISTFPSCKGVCGDAQEDGGQRTRAGGIKKVMAEYFAHRQAAKIVAAYRLPLS